MENMQRPEDEIQFKNMSTNPIRLFGLVYPLILVLVIAAGMYWVYNLDTAYINRLPYFDLKRDTTEPEIVPASGSVVQGVKISEISNSTPELIAKGKELFQTNCAACHGTDGKGDGVGGAALNPKPRNFISPDGWKNGRKLSEIWKSVEEGIPGSGMISYNFMPVTDRFAIIHYIHSLMGDFPKNTPDELQQLDMAYKLSEGKSTPGKITLASAFQKLENEHKNTVEEVNTIISEIEKNQTDNGSVIFEKVAKNKNKAITSLLNSPNWKSGINEFYAELASNININGFKPEVLKLSKNDLQTLYDLLNRSVKS
jgi:mono/diheme cytochrome c family protein